MGKLTELLNNARTRARELGLPYAGSLTPKEAHEVWNLAPGPNSSMYARAPSGIGSVASPVPRKSNG